MPNVAADAHAPQFRLFASLAGPRLLVIPHSRIFAIDQKFANALGHNDGWAVAQISQLAESLAAEVSLDAIPATTPQSISLNVSSTCNLGCSYCYAGQGEFNGAQTSAMSWT